MADRFELNERDARRAGRHAGKAAERLVAAHRDLVAVLDAREGCWGDDDIGTAFSKNYVSMADGTRKNTEILGTNLSDVGEQIGVLAGYLADTDESNAHAIDKAYAEDVESWTEKP